jgi:hypothetical protein
MRLSSDWVIEIFSPQLLAERRSLAWSGFLTEFGWDGIALRGSGRVGGIQVFGYASVAAPTRRAKSTSFHGHSELFSRIEERLQIRNVQRRSWKERGWRCLSVTAGWSATPLTKQPGQWSRSGGKTAMGLTAGEIIWTRGRTGGARFTGVSASLNAVSGKSGRGMTDTQTAAVSRKKTNVKRNRITSLRLSP